MVVGFVSLELFGVDAEIGLFVNDVGAVLELGVVGSLAVDSDDAFLLVLLLAV